MKILVTGKGTSGSWLVRGVQLGQAIGATVKPKADLSDCQKADMIVVIKRFGHEVTRAIKKSGRKWAWDLVDFYPQPQCTAWNREHAIAWVKTQIRCNRPDGIIWPNQQMMDDCAVDIPGIVIYHHHRPGIEINPIRDRVRIVGYEGSPNYLAEWLPEITRECSIRGWDFVINPDSLAALDIVLAVRGDAFNGYAQSHWKSQVKLANAHGSGTPFVGMPERAYLETAAGGEQWVCSPSDLSSAFNVLSDLDERRHISRAFRSKSITIDDCSKRLAGFLSGL